MAENICLVFENEYFRSANEYLVSENKHGASKNEKMNLCCLKMNM